MRRGRAMMLIGIIALIVLGVIPLVIAGVIYEMNFGRRYETGKGYSYEIADFEELGVELYSFKSSKGARLQGYHYFNEEELKPRGLIVLAHGFGGGGHKSYMPEINAFVEGGYEVFTYDVTGNDKSEGKGVGGLPQGMLDLDKALSFVETTEAFKDLPILLYGHSWGGYSVMTVLNKEHPIAGGVALSGFNKTTNMLIEQGERMYGKGAKLLSPYIGWYEKMKFGKESSLTALEGLKKSEIPMLLIHSEDDRTVGFLDNHDYLEKELTDHNNIIFRALKTRGHEPLRTEEKQYELKTLNESYRKLKEQYGNKSDIPVELLEKLYSDNKEVYGTLDKVLMKDILAFYDKVVGYEEKPVFALEKERLFENGYKKAEEQLELMTLEEKVGQMLLARCPEGEGVQAIKDYHLGGYVLFKRDFEGKTKKEVQQILASYKEASPIPFILAVDEEGGSVVRISSNPNLVEAPYLSPQALDKKGGLEAIEEETIKKSQTLKSLGITMNLSPVADISINPTDYIYARTLGKGSEETAAYVEKVVKGTQSVGISATLKHFPGYGGNIDTHMEVGVDKRSYEQFVKSDYLPFKEGIKAGVHSILVSHNIVEALDSKYPASLSPKVHEELRNKLGFTGIIMTDDLEMKGIKNFNERIQSEVQAVLAGNDLLIVTNFKEAYENILEGISTGVLSEEIVNQAVIRILAWKYSL